MKKKKVLLDTDIGTDIDDAICLAYLLAQPECDLMGITTVTGEPKKRAMMASLICKAAGKNVPIFPGAEKPLIVPQLQTKAQQAKIIKNWEHKKDFTSGKAVEFLRNTIRKNPGEISLLTIGPLTNIALLFRIDPEIPLLLNELVMMTGSFYRSTGFREWNAFGDPHATAIVYKSPVKLHRSVPLDVTNQVKMSADELNKRFTTDLLKPVKKFADVYFQYKKQKRTSFHDPLAAATIFEKDICDYKNGEIEVELINEKTMGATYLNLDEKGPHEVALEVDSQRFFKHFFSVF